MSLGLADLERKFFQEDYAPGLSTGRVVERENLAINPKLEVNSGGWGIYAGSGAPAAALSRETGSGLSFANYFSRATWSVSPNSVSGGLYYGIPPNRPALSPGKTYTASYYVRSSVAQQLRVTMEWRKADGNASAFPNASGTTVTLVPDTWTRISVTATSPADVGSVTPTVYPAAGGIIWPPGSTLDITAIVVEESSSVGTYFDGDTPDFTNGTYEWEGTPHQSVSRLVVPEPIIAENLFRPGVSNTNLTSFVGANLEEYFNGPWHRYTKDAGSTGILRAYVDLDALVDGKTYYAGCTVYNPTNTPISVYLDWADDGENHKIYRILPGEERQITVSGARALYSIIYRFLDISMDIPSSGELWVKDITVVDKPFGSVFNGDSPNAFWTGIPLNTRSRLIDINSRDQNYLEYSYWAKRSGLTPKEKFSYADHMLAALRNEHDPVAGDPSSVVRKNLHPRGNPSSVTGIGVVGSHSGATISRETDYSSGVTSGIGRVTSSAAGPALGIGISIGYDIEPGEYTASFYIRSSIDRSFTSFFQGTSVRNNHQASLGSLTANIWKRVSKTFQITSKGTLQIGGYVNEASSAAGETLDITGILLEEGSQVNDYFDGDSSKARWTGTPYDSISELTNPLVMSSTDLLVSRYMAGSGLPGNMSISDHMVQYFKNKLGL